MADNNSVFATNKDPTLPGMENMLYALEQQVLKKINCARVCAVLDYQGGNTVDVQVAQKQVTSTKPDGTETIEDYPLLLRVPIVFWGGGGITVTFPLQAGDEGVLIFNDRELDNWQANGSGYIPTSGRLHDLSDAMAIFGLRNDSRALANISTTGAQIRTDDGTTFVEVNAAGVKVHSGTVYEWDVHGYGQRITWTGGSNYTIDNYTVGAIITTNNHNIAPPGPP